MPFGNSFRNIDKLITNVFITVVVLFFLFITLGVYSYYRSSKEKKNLVEARNKYLKIGSQATLLILKEDSVNQNLFLQKVDSLENIK